MRISVVAYKFFLRHASMRCLAADPAKGQWAQVYLA